MPVVTFARGDLCSLIGEDIPLDTLTERMPMIGGDLDKVEGDDITIEWFPDRPDLLTPEGTARAMKAFLGIGTGLTRYEVQAATTELHVDASVAAVRPYAALCFVKGVPIDDAYLEAVIDAQEKLTLAPGRKRRKIAIGIHDASGLEGPFTYTCVAGDEKPFEPLAWEGALTPAEIMTKHPKGQEYAHLLPDGKYPVFLDGAGDVLSLPPVINAAKTTVTTQTRDLLLDVTGTDPASVRHTIALLATGFADRGGTIEAVKVHDASGTWTCPDLKPTEKVIEVAPANRWLGLDLTADEMAACLQRMGHHAEGFENKILVESPPWRFDLMHDVDWLEDIAIGHGFENFEGSLPIRITYGDALEHQGLEDKLRELLVGHGFFEARTLTLSNAADQWSHWGEEPGGAVTVRNPVLEEQTLLRVKLVPSLLHVLAANRHRSLPQRLFELGYVVVEEDGRWRNRLRLAVVEQAARAGFSRVKGLAEAILRDAGIEATLEAADVPGHISGRAGTIVADGTAIGSFGELHPDTIVAFGLGAATTAIEIDVTAVADAHK